MIFADVDEAQTYRSKLIKRAKAGEEVVVAIVAYEASSELRTPGLLAGQIEIAPGFDEPHQSPRHSVTEAPTKPE